MSSKPDVQGWPRWIANRVLPEAHAYHRGKYDSACGRDSLLTAGPMKQGDKKCDKCIAALRAAGIEEGS